MKRRWKLLLGALAFAAAGIAAPVAYIETSCTAPLPGLQANAPYRPLMPGSEGSRREANSWLTFPEWYIVYSAESYGRFIARERPSRFPFLAHVRGFWSGFCASSRAAAGSGAAADYKVMIYTIGISYSAEMLLKGLYETTWGRAFEWIGGHDSGNDRYTAAVQQRYGAFMHETPWYRFGFGDALAGLWTTPATGNALRHWERRFVHSAEYGFKSLYAAALGWASGAALGRDELTLRFVARAEPAALAAADPRFRPVGRLPGGLTIVEAPRYAQFTGLLQRLSATDAALVEIAGNDDIFVTVRAPVGRPAPAGTVQLLSAPLDDRPGWRRLGLAVKVERLLPLLRELRATGAELEHAYDY
ncbi:MAG TPA: hypothetical protein VF552_08650 [Allosphingosinicella sp.]